MDECLYQQKNTLQPFVLVGEQCKQGKRLFYNKLVVENLYLDKRLPIRALKI